MSAKDMFYPEGKEFSVAEKRAFAREELVYNVTEDILVALEDMGIAKKELARRLGKSKSYVTQILSGVRNMTLATLSDICFALEIKPKVILDSKPAHETLDVDNNWINIWSTHIEQAEEKYWSDFIESNSVGVDFIREAENIIDYKNNDKCMKKWKNCEREVA